MYFAVIGIVEHCKVIYCMQKTVRTLVPLHSFSNTLEQSTTLGLAFIATGSSRKAAIPKSSNQSNAEKNGICMIVNAVRLSCNAGLCVCVCVWLIHIHIYIHIENKVSVPDQKKKMNSNANGVLNIYSFTHISYLRVPVCIRNVSSYTLYRCVKAVMHILCVH